MLSSLGDGDTIFTFGRLRVSSKLSVYLWEAKNMHMWFADSISFVGHDDGLFARVQVNAVLSSDCLAGVLLKVVAGISGYPDPE